MRRRAVWLALALAPALMGFIDVPIHPGDVVKTNATLIGRVGAPAEQAPIAGYTFTENWLVAPFGKLHTVIAESDPKKPLIVACGGNGFQEPVKGAAALQSLAPFGDVVLFDYPGLGRSQGTGHKSEYLAAVPVLAEAVSAIAAKRSGPVIFWGHSLGGGYCAALAAAYPQKSTLVMEGAFASIADIADAKAGAAAPLVRLNIDPETLQLDVPALLAAYQNPIVIVGSKDDETIPFATTRRLSERLQKAGKAVRFVSLSGSGHGTLRQNPEYAAKLSEALGFAANPPAPLPTPPAKPCSDGFVRNGCGTLIWPDGARLSGTFEKGKFEGAMTVAFADGAKLVASYTGGEGRGNARYATADGTVHEGVFADAVLDTERTPKEALTNFPFWRALTEAEATISIYTFITESGDVANLTADVPESFTPDDIEALNRGLAAVFAKWKFKPGTIAGTPVRIPGVFSIHYVGTGS